MAKDRKRDRHRPGYFKEYRARRKAKQEAQIIMDVLQLLEPGEYPDGSDAEMAVISIAVSLKRLADQGAGQVVSATKTSGKRVVGQAEKPAANGKRSVGAAETVADFPEFKLPAGFTEWHGDSDHVPLLPDEEVTVIWRNGKRQKSATQSFHWGWGVGGKPDHDILAYRAAEPDPALTEVQK